MKTEVKDIVKKEGIRKRSSRICFNFLKEAREIKGAIEKKRVEEM